jgi:superfamily II DNA/RNA helicase
MAKSKREEIVKEYNANKIKVLLISKAGGEGLDLKETRNIIIMEPSWNEATHKQVIGRAIRYKSHETLPKEKRRVDVYRLYLIKPNEDAELERLITNKSLLFGEGEDAETLAVDLYLRNFVMLKQEKIDEFLEELRKLTIEKNRC